MEREQVLAVDIVFLLRAEDQGVAINLSRQIPGSSFYLNREDRLPHLTLAMGYIDNLSLAKDKVSEVAKEAKAFDLEMKGTDRQFIDIENSFRLLALHKKILERINFLKIDDRPEAFVDYSVDPPRVSTLDWIRNFKSDHSYEKYEPHITLGITQEKFELRSNDFPRIISVDEITLCHLGNFNTCRIILGKWQLSGH